jgi:hypothetical protein
MAAENIDNTVTGTGLFPAKVPGLSDAADIQAALKLYHYGSYTYDGSNTNPANLVTPSIAKHLQNLKDADTAATAALAAHEADTTNIHGIVNTASLATQTYVNTAISSAVNGVTGEYSNLAGTAIDWNSVDERFDVEPRLANAGTIITKTENFILSASDVGKTAILYSSNPMTVTLPLNASVEIPVGYSIDIIQTGAGSVTVNPETNAVSVNSKSNIRSLDGQYSKGTLVKIDTNTWFFFGNLLNVVTPVTPVAPTPVAPTPVAPTPVAPTPVAPTPVAPTPVAPTPVAPTPVAPTPVAPTPVAPTPVAPTPVAPTLSCPPPGDISGSFSDPCSFDPTRCCNSDGVPWVAPTPTAPTPSTPTPVAPTPVAPTLSCPPPGDTSGSFSDPCSFDPTRCCDSDGRPYVAPTPTAPTPVAPTPVAPTPVAPTPVNVCDGDISMLNSSQCTACGYYYSTRYGECLPSNPNTPTPVTPTPVAPTPVAPTPTATCPFPGMSGSYDSPCGNTCCDSDGRPWVAPTPVAPTPTASYPALKPGLNYCAQGDVPNPASPCVQSDVTNGNCKDGGASGSSCAPAPVAPTPVAPTPVALDCSGNTCLPGSGSACGTYGNGTYCITPGSCQNVCNGDHAPAPAPVAPTPVALDCSPCNQSLSGGACGPYGNGTLCWTPNGCPNRCDGDHPPAPSPVATPTPAAPAPTGCVYTGSLPPVPCGYNMCVYSNCGDFLGYTST